jgi:hypothetical protein
MVVQMPPKPSPGAARRHPGPRSKGRGGGRRHRARVRAALARAVEEWAAATVNQQEPAPDADIVDDADHTSQATHDVSTAMLFHEAAAVLNLHA